MAQTRCSAFPEGYSVYQTDHNDGNGGVFITCRESFISCNLEIENNNCELVACKIKLQNNGSLIVCSAYRLPSSSVDYLNQHPNSAIWLSVSLTLIGKIIVLMDISTL